MLKLLTWLENEKISYLTFCCSFLLRTPQLTKFILANYFVKALINFRQMLGEHSEASSDAHAGDLWGKFFSFPLWTQTFFFKAEHFSSHFTDSFTLSLSTKILQKFFLYQKVVLRFRLFFMAVFFSMEVWKWKFQFFANWAKFVNYKVIQSHVELVFVCFPRRLIKKHCSKTYSTFVAVKPNFDCVSLGRVWKSS